MQNKVGEIVDTLPDAVNAMNNVANAATNAEWLMKSQAIASKVLNTIRAKKLTQAQLAILMKVSPQQVSRVIKGKENLTLETISNLERALGIKLIDVAK